MGLHEPDYLSRFLSIINTCDTHPYRTQSEKTGRILQLHCIDSIMYIDIENMLWILSEIFDTIISPEIINYIRKVLFIETMNVDVDGVETEKELICINLIDNKALLKFHNWLFDHFTQKNAEGRVFQRFEMAGMAKPYNNFYYNDQQSPGMRDSYSYDSHWNQGECENPFSLSYMPIECSMPSPPKGYPLAYAKPRGKQVPCRKEPCLERPFVCEFFGCKRAFKRQEHLKRHIKMHTGERPFKCLFPGCQKSFSRSDNLNSHYKTHNIVRGRSCKSYNATKTIGDY